VTVGMGYDVSLYVGLEAIGTNGAARYQAFSTTDQEGLWQLSLVMPDDVYMIDGETLKAYVDVQRPGGGMQPMTGELEFAHLIDRAAAPTGLQVTPADSIVTVDFADVSQADQYRLYRKRGSNPWERATVWDKVSSVTLPDRVYIPPEASAKDHSLAQDPETGRYHVIGIDAAVSWDAGGEKALYHTSTDFSFSGEVHHPYLEIQHLTDTMDPGGEWGTADGYRIDHLWAPELKLHGGLWHLWFAGIDRTDPVAGNRIERIFYSTMPHTADITDPENWSPAVMVLEGSGGVGGTTGITAPTGYSEASGHRALCRDPFVSYNHQDDTWYMVMTVAAQTTGQAIGLASAPTISGPWTLQGYFTGTNGTTRESPVFTWWPDQELWFVHYNAGGQTGWGYGPALLGALTIGSPNISGLAAYEPLSLPSRWAGSYLTAWPEQTAEAHSWLVMAPRMGYNYNWLRQVTARMDGSGMRLSSRPVAQLLVQDPNSMGSPPLEDRSYTPGASYNYTVTAVTGGEVSEQAVPKSVTGYRDIEIDNLLVSYSGVIQGNWTVTVEPREVSWQWRARTAVNESATEPDCAQVANWSAWSSWATVDRPARSAGAQMISVAEDRWLSVDVEVRSASRPLEVYAACSSAYRPLNLPTPSGFVSDHPVPGNPAMVDRDAVEFSWTNTAAEHPNFEGYYVTWERSGGDDCDGGEYITRPPGEWPDTWDDPTWTVTWQHQMQSSQDPCNGYYTYRVASYGGSLTSGTVSALVEWIEFAVGLLLNVDVEYTINGGPATVAVSGVEPSQNGYQIDVQYLSSYEWLFSSDPEYIYKTRAQGTYSGVIPPLETGQTVGIPDGVYHTDSISVYLSALDPAGKPTGIPAQVLEEVVYMPLGSVPVIDHSGYRVGAHVFSHMYEQGLYFNTTYQDVAKTDLMIMGWSAVLGNYLYADFDDGAWQHWLHEVRAVGDRPAVSIGFAGNAFRPNPAQPVTHRAYARINNMYLAAFEEGGTRADSNVWVHTIGDTLAYGVVTPNPSVPMRLVNITYPPAREAAIRGYVDELNHSDNRLPMIGFLFDVWENASEHPIHDATVVPPGNPMVSALSLADFNLNGVAAYQDDADMRALREARRLWFEEFRVALEVQTDPEDAKWFLLGANSASAAGDSALAAQLDYIYLEDFQTPGRSGHGYYYRTGPWNNRYNAIFPYHFSMDPNYTVVYDQAYWSSRWNILYAEDLPAPPDYKPYFANLRTVMRSEGGGPWIHLIAAGGASGQDNVDAIDPVYNEVFSLLSDNVYVCWLHYAVEHAHEGRPRWIIKQWDHPDNYSHYSLRTLGQPLGAATSDTVGNEIRWTRQFSNGGVYIAIADTANFDGQGPDGRDLFEYLVTLNAEGVSARVSPGWTPW
jgi:hypothetical protein